jgi:hypothetical protein
MAFEQFTKHGNPGKFAATITVTSGELYCTGSNFGVSAIIRGQNATGTVELSAGGSIDLADLDAGIIHEISPQAVKSIQNGKVYLLKRG